MDDVQEQTQMVPEPSFFAFPSSSNIFSPRRWIPRIPILSGKPIGRLQFCIGHFSNPLNKGDSFTLKCTDGESRSGESEVGRKGAQRRKNGLSAVLTPIRHRKYDLTHDKCMSD